MKKEKKDGYELTKDQKQIFDKREKEILDGSVKTKSWEEVKQNLKRRNTKNKNNGKYIP